MLLGELRLRRIGLKLQQLKMDLQVVVFTDITGLEALTADVHAVLKAHQVLLGEIERGLGDLQRVGMYCEATLKSERALAIGYLRGCDGCSVLGCLQAVLPFLAPLEQGS